MTNMHKHELSQADCYLVELEENQTLKITINLVKKKKRD